LPGLLPDAPTGLDLVAAVGVATARGVAAQLGRDPFVEADPTRSHAEDLVRLALGPVGALQARGRALDAYLATVMDHGLNASTFTARVVTSTGADDLSAVVAALGALSGPLHGGAPGPVLDMLDAIGTPEAAEAWLRTELAAGRRIMGMGHRVYRVRDPRVAALDAAATRLATAGVGGERLALARKVEAAAREVLAAHKPDRPLHANVELATAVLLDAIGLPREAFSSLFAAGRVGGWLAHATEQRRNGRLVRPRAAYVGR
jgi:citrate synthase